MCIIIPVVHIFKIVLKSPLESFLKSVPNIYNDDNFKEGFIYLYVCVCVHMCMCVFVHLLCDSVNIACSCS